MAICPSDIKDHGYAPDIRSTAGLHRRLGVAFCSNGNDSGLGAVGAQGWIDRISDVWRRRSPPKSSRGANLAQPAVPAERTQANYLVKWPLGREPVTGIEPALSAWEADVLPLNYTGVGTCRPAGKDSRRVRGIPNFPGRRGGPQRAPGAVYPRCFGSQCSGTELHRPAHDAVDAGNSTGSSEPEHLENLLDLRLYRSAAWLSGTQQPGRVACPGSVPGYMSTFGSQFFPDCPPQMPHHAMYRKPDSALHKNAGPCGVTEPNPLAASGPSCGLRPPATFRSDRLANFSHDPYHTLLTLGVLRQISTGTTH